MKEYRVLLWGRNVAVLEAGLNALASQGWQLHTLFGPHLVIEREAAEKALPASSLGEQKEFPLDSTAASPPTSENNDNPQDQPTAQVDTPGRGPAAEGVS